MPERLRDGPLDGLVLRDRDGRAHDLHLRPGYPSLDTGTVFCASRARSVPWRVLG
jgi:hypothetical protein